MSRLCLQCLGRWMTTVSTRVAIPATCIVAFRMTLASTGPDHDPPWSFVETFHIIYIHLYNTVDLIGDLFVERIPWETHRDSTVPRRWCTWRRRTYVLTRQGCNFQDDFRWFPTCFHVRTRCCVLAHAHLSHLIMFDFQTGLLPMPKLPIVCIYIYIFVYWYYMIWSNIVFCSLLIFVWLRHLSRPILEVLWQVYQKDRSKKRLTSCLGRSFDAMNLADALSNALRCNLCKVSNRWFFSAVLRNWCQIFWLYLANCAPNMHICK